MTRPADAPPAPKPPKPVKRPGLRLERAAAWGLFQMLAYVWMAWLAVSHGDQPAQILMTTPRLFLPSFDHLPAYGLSALFWFATGVLIGYFIKKHNLLLILWAILYIVMTAAAFFAAQALNFGTFPN
jgi:hypothetical protein